jgi:hypothetical protein
MPACDACALDVAMVAFRSMAERLAADAGMTASEHERISRGYKMEFQQRFLTTDPPRQCSRSGCTSTASQWLRSYCYPYHVQRSTCDECINQVAEDMNVQVQHIFDHESDLLSAQFGNMSMQQQ